MAEVGDFVADKLILLKRALAEETKRREAVEQQAAENATRRTELEGALGEIQLVQDAFQQELETAENPKQLLELQSSLAASEQAREMLEGDLEVARRELQALRLGRTAEESELEARTMDLQASQADAEQKVRTLTEALTAETSRWEGAEQMALETAKRQSELEVELAEISKAQVQVRQQLEESQSQLQAREESAAAERSKLE